MAIFDLFKAKIVISVRNQPKLDQSWQRHGQTEVSEVSKIPKNLKVKIQPQTWIFYSLFTLSF